MTKRTPFTTGNQLAKGNPGPTDRGTILAHAMQAIQRMQEGKPLGSVMELMREFKWTQAHAYTVRKSALGFLREMTHESVAETRARLLALCDAQLERCEEYVTGSGGKFEGTVILRHPKTKELLTRMNHKAIQGYMRIVTELTGAAIEAAPNASENRPMRDMPTAELVAMMSDLENEKAGRSKTVEASVRPSKRKPHG